MTTLKNLHNPNLHLPVLLKETIQALNPQEGKKFIDCTLGDGGHTIELLKNGSTVLGIDYDSDSLDTAHKRIESSGLSKKFTFAQGNFRDISQIAQRHSFQVVDAILYDLGYSSSQLENKDGLSLRKDSPLDMRLDQKLSVTAADLINALSEAQLTKLFSQYGEEHFSKRIAKAIVLARNKNQILTTSQLSEVVGSSVAPKHSVASLTRVYQALRIVVNDEFENLRVSLPQAIHLLKLPGRIAVISFHSLEDRIVKQFVKDVWPNKNSGIKLRFATRKPLVPSEQEVKNNSRARSAKLRIIDVFK